MNHNGIKSDHSTVNIELEFNKNSKECGLWKFNADLLKDENYVMYINKYIEDLKFRKPKIKNTVIIQCIPNGGLKAPDFIPMVKSSKVIWMKRISTTTNLKMKDMINEFLTPLTFDNILQGNLCSDFIMDIKNDFYKQILLYWNDLQVVKMQPGSLLNQTIWCNKSIVSKVAIKGNVCKPLVMKTTCGQV